MRWPRHVLCAAACLALAAAPVARGEQDNTLPYVYLKAYLKINDAFQLEKQNNLAGALIDFKESYAQLQKIHNRDPNWESALVIGRMNDCRTKIIELTNTIAAQGPGTPSTPAPQPTTAIVNTPPAGNNGSGSSNDVAVLKQKLQQVEAELQETKNRLHDSEDQVATLKTSLAAVNQELAALKSSESGDNQVGRLLTQNKALTEKLDAAQKEIASIKSPTKGSFALLRTQLKNSQDQLAASEAANTALQQTTTTLNQQLDDAQADLRAANQRLASAPANAPEYAALKHENEVMREILTRELQEQAHRDMAKRLAQEEFDRLRLTSKVLQEQLDILGSPMTPPTTDQERALLDSLRASGPQIAGPPPETGNGFSAPANPAQNSGSTPAAGGTTDNSSPPSGSTHAVTTTNGASTPSTDTNAAPSVASKAATNTPAATPPLTNQALTDANNNVSGSTPTPPSSVTPASAPSTNTPDAGTNAVTSATAASSTNSVASSSPSADSQTNQPAATPPDTNAAATPSMAASTNAAPATPPSTNTATTTPPGGETNATASAPPPGSADANDYAKKARLPEDMRDTAQQAADLFKMQRYDDASAKYQEIIDKYPESLYAWSNLGVVRFQQGKMPEALKALQRAVSLSPTDAFSYQNLGIVYYQMGQYENAISALERALALDPSNAKSHNYLGCACSQKGWSEVAEKEFLKAIEIDDTFGDAHFNLALVYATEKPPALEMARRHYKRALELGISPDPRLEKLLQMDGVAENRSASTER